MYDNDRNRRPYKSVGTLMDESDSSDPETLTTLLKKKTRSPMFSGKSNESTKNSVVPEPKIWNDQTETSVSLISQKTEVLKKRRGSMGVLPTMNFRIQELFPKKSNRTLIEQVKCVCVSVLYAVFLFDFFKR